jgi:SAM-dependent methyltransferase
MSHPIDLLTEARAFMRSRILLTAAELDLFTFLHETTAAAGEMADALRVDRRALTRLLDALVAMGALTKDGGRYANTDASSTLSDRNPQSMRASLLHQVNLWQTWGRLTEAVRTGTSPDRRSAARAAGEESERERTRAFIGAMEVVARQRATATAEAVPAGGRRRLLDIGGGPASYTIAFLQKSPHLQATLFDLPEVIALARVQLEKAGLLDRVRLVAGDFYQDELPPECDLALLSAIIHQNSPVQNEELFGKVFRALAPGGVLVIRDHIMEEDRVRPIAGAFFAINMLVGTRGGDTYTFAEVERGLLAAGFTGVTLARKGDNMDCLVEAQKPV